MKQGTGAVWRITRDQSVSAGDLPPEPKRVPFYPIQAGVVALALAGGATLVVRLIRRLRRK